MYKRILVPLDGSPLAEAALAQARELARWAVGTLLLMRVVSYPLVSVVRVDPTFSGTLTDDFLALRGQAEAYVEEIAARLRQDGLDVQTQIVDDASPADAILDTVQSLKVDLIVMSTHGRSGVSRWLLGSVADRVVHHSLVPVLLVRPVPPEGTEREHATPILSAASPDVKLDR